MTQEFHLSVTPIGGNEYLVRTERVAPGVPLAEEQVTWAVEEWLAQAGILMNDPLTGLLRGENLNAIPVFDGAVANGTTLASSSLIQVGQQLYNALFQGTIRDSWMTARGISQHLRQVLRLRLGLKDARLPRLPWEVMYAGDRPLATGTDVLFSRYHSSFAALTSSNQFQQTPALQPHHPLRILMVLAAPNDQESLALKQEAQHLQEELQQAASSHPLPGSGIELTILEQPGREQLTQALEHNYYQIFHYAGHSNPGTAGGSLYLVNRRTGLTEMLSGDDLAGLLVNNGIRMAVFNSCRGVYAATSADSDAGNLAEALVRRGIPSVLAMAERIPDDVALNLSRLFYRNLKQGYPIDLSLNRARQGLISSYGSNQLYWALPILYLHPQFEGYLQPEIIARDRPDLSLEALAAAEPDLFNESALPETQEDWQLPADPEAEEALVAGFNLDELEFDDPDYGTDWETVARMVNQLSTGETQPELDSAIAVTTLTQVADPNESLLPNPEPKQRPEYPLPTDLQRPIDTPPNRSAESSEAAIATAVVDEEDPELYQELERLLAEAGKSTPEMAACLQRLRHDPQDAEAYHQLGQALMQQGYLTEAIAAYHQALRLAPAQADFYHHLGTALLQQGNLAQAIQALNRAIQLDPNLSEAYQKLGQAIRRQSPPEKASRQLISARPISPEAALPYPKDATAYLPRYSSALESPRQTPWLWAGVGAASVVMVVMGGWFVHQHLANQPLLPGWAPIAQQPENQLAQVETAKVTAIAMERLSRGDVPGGQVAIEALLDRKALSAAETAMNTVQVKQVEDPVILFLKGRLAWQSSMQNNNRDYSLYDARRFWENAASRRPTPLSQNALGFVYYSEGNWSLASKAWHRTLELFGLPEDPQDMRSSPKEALTAYAGIALSLMKTAQTLPSERRAAMQQAAIRLRQKVLSAAPADFNPENMAKKDWLWSEKAIADWQTLMALK